MERHSLQVEATAKLVAEREAKSAVVEKKYGQGLPLQSRVIEFQLEDNAFDIGRSKDIGVHFATNRAVSEKFSNRLSGGKVFEVFLNIRDLHRVNDLFSRYHGLRSALNEMYNEGLVTDSQYRSLAARAQRADRKDLEDERYWGELKDVTSFWGKLNGILQKKKGLGFVYNNEVEGGGWSYVALQPTQIKSATKNSGVFDPENPDIRFSRKRLAQSKQNAASFSAGGRVIAPVLAGETARKDGAAANLSGNTPSDVGGPSSGDSRLRERSSNVNSPASGKMEGVRNKKGLLWERAQTNHRKTTPSAVSGRSKPSNANIDTSGVDSKRERLSLTGRALLAPNGNPSSLTPEQHAEVRTPEFKAWAGDWEAVAGQEMERKKGETALDALLQNKTGEVEAMSRPGLGQVVFIYGTPGRLNTKGRLVGGGGVAHMIEQRNLEGKDGEFIARKMPEVIAHGEVTAIQGEGTSGERVRIVHDGHTAVLSLYQNGSRKTWLLSGWENEGGGAGVNPATAYASDGSGISRQKGASSDKRISLNAHVVKPSSISVRLDKNGEPLVRDGQYENSRTGEKRDVGSFVHGAPTRFKRSAPAAKTTPKNAGKSGSFEHIFDRMRVLFQDQFLPVKRVQELLQSQGRKMDPDADAYLAEERYHGRAGYRLEKFQEDHVAPLMEKIRDSGTSILELEDYLYAKYAPQRNAHIASINPKMPDGGSGRTNKWAADTLARFEKEGKTAKLEALAKDVRAITKMQRDTIRKEGLEDDEVIDAWELANPDYVPLKGKADDQGHGRAIGTGFNVKGSGTKRALGRSTPATDILANLIAQTGDTLVRAEKARVGRAFYRMVEENPDADRWIIHEQLPSRRAMVNGQVRNVTDFSFPMEPNVITVTLPGGGVRYIELFEDRKSTR